MVDSSGNLIAPISTALQTDVNEYLTVNPPSGADQTQVNSWIGDYLQANPPSTPLTVDALKPLLTALNVSWHLNYNTPHYDFSLANHSFMYANVAPGSYDASTQWRVEAWVYYISGSGSGSNAYATILDNRAVQNWSNDHFMVINIWQDKPAIVSPDATSEEQFGYLTGTQTVPQNQWSHIVWQCSPSTGLMTFVNGVLSVQTGFSPGWNNQSGNLCFGATVDFQQGEFYHLNGSISQLLFRAGASVEQYSASGFTPPADLSAVASGKTDVVYLMQHGFQNLTVPSGCTVLETST
jgi:hypothetical protein